VPDRVPASDRDEVVDQGGSQSLAPIVGVDEPFDPTYEAQGASLTLVEGGIGNDSITVDCHEREDLGIVDISAPAFDQRPVLDVVPRKAAHVWWQPAEKLEEIIDVGLGERTNENTLPIAHYRFLGKTIRHEAPPESEKSGHEGYWVLAASGEEKILAGCETPFWGLRDRSGYSFSTTFKRSISMVLTCCSEPSGQ
jgi:hypothetical protein